MINNKNKDRNNDKTIGNQMRNGRTHDNGTMRLGSRRSVA